MCGVLPTALDDEAAYLNDDYIITFAFVLDDGTTPRDMSTAVWTATLFDDVGEGHTDKFAVDTTDDVEGLVVLTLPSALIATYIADQPFIRVALHEATLYARTLFAWRVDLRTNGDPQGIGSNTYTVEQADSSGTTVVVQMMESGPPAGITADAPLHYDPTSRTFSLANIDGGNAG